MYTARGFHCLLLVVLLGTVGSCSDGNGPSDGTKPPSELNVIHVAPTTTIRRRRHGHSPKPVSGSSTSSISTARLPGDPSMATVVERDPQSDRYPHAARRRHPRRGAIENWLERGIDRVMLGTASLRDPGLVHHAAADLPGSIVVGIDARDGRWRSRAGPKRGS